MQPDCGVAHVLLTTAPAPDTAFPPMARQLPVGTPCLGTGVLWTRRTARVTQRVAFNVWLLSRSLCARLIHVEACARTSTLFGAKQWSAVGTDCVSPAAVVAAMSLTHFVSTSLRFYS